MEEQDRQRRIFSLFEVAESIRKAISNTFTGYYWVKAEITKLNYYPKSGHCYPDLVEKEHGHIKAQIRANIWSGNFIKISNKFRTVTGEPLKDGIHVLFLSRVNFHEQYGLSLNIIDIEPSFTLGEMAREKQETIRKLQKEGLFILNKSLYFPILPKRIAIVSVETSKGYSDFLKVIQNNNYGFQFECRLFPALLQGNGAVRSIKQQLDAIEDVTDVFDAVAIIRGGGGEVGLNAYDNYELAKSVATCSLPVITGIGHSTNETVVQMVAYANKITPTEAGHFLLQQFHNFAVRLKLSEKNIVRHSRERLSKEQRKMSDVLQLFKSKTQNMIEHNIFDINMLVQTFKNEVHNLLLKKRQNIIGLSTNLHIRAQQQSKTATIKLHNTQNYLVIHLKQRFINENNLQEQLQTKLQLLNPKNILKRGYSITYHKGKVVKNAAQLKTGDIIISHLNKGTIESKVEK